VFIELEENSGVAGVANPLESLTEAPGQSAYGERGSAADRDTLKLYVQ
jgi:hypothetical protein